MLDTLEPAVTKTICADDSESLVAVLTRLYSEQLQIERLPYLVDHSRPSIVTRQVRAFQWYFPYLAEAQTILDLGCAHGPDSCLLRASLGPKANLHGCDFWEPGRFRPFREFAAMRYVRMTGPSRIPYGDWHFDAIIASGVLEHSAMDYELLKEAYRVLRPGGRLVITYLPNRYSIQEWFLRNVRKSGFHRRTYTKSDVANLLSRSGFYPVSPIRNQFFDWETFFARLGSPRVTRALDRIVKSVMPIHVFSSVLCCVAEKLDSM